MSTPPVNTLTGGVENYVGGVKKIRGASHPPQANLCTRPCIWGIIIHFQHYTVHIFVIINTYAFSKWEKVKEIEDRITKHFLITAIWIVITFTIFYAILISGIKGWINGFQKPQKVLGKFSKLLVFQSSGENETGSWEELWKLQTVKQTAIAKFVAFNLCFIICIIMYISSWLLFYISSHLVIALPTISIALDVAL